MSNQHSHINTLVYIVWNNEGEFEIEKEQKQSKVVCRVDSILSFLVLYFK